MEVASVSQTKNKLSHYLKLVRNGGTVIIMDRGVPVARLESVSTPGNTVGRLERLVQTGVAEGGKGKIPNNLLKLDPVKLEKPVDVVKLIREERDKR